MDDFLTQFNQNLTRLETDEEYREELLVAGHGNPQPLGPRVVSAADWVSDMVTGAKAKASKWEKNSLNPRKDPKDAALAAAGKWTDKMQTAIAGGHFAKGVSAYDETARQTVIKKVGASGFSSGVENHRAKAESKIAKLQPMVAVLAGTIDGMPQDSDSDREARMLAARRGMIEIGKKMKGI